MIFSSTKEILKVIKIPTVLCMEHRFKPSMYYLTYGPNEPAYHVKPGDVVIAPTVDAGGNDSRGISIPDDIRVLVKPLGGAEDYESLFHEMGHAEHYAHVLATDYEFRVLGEDGVTETFAFLFENLFMDPKFLDKECEGLYPQKDYHTLYFGEILACYETE